MLLDAKCPKMNTFNQFIPRVIEHQHRKTVAFSIEVQKFLEIDSLPHCSKLIFIVYFRIFIITDSAFPYAIVKNVKIINDENIP